MVKADKSLLAMQPSAVPVADSQFGPRQPGGTETHSPAYVFPASTQYLQASPNLQENSIEHRWQEIPLK